MRALVVTAVPAEAEAAVRGLTGRLRDTGPLPPAPLLPGHELRRLAGDAPPVVVDVLAAGVGPAAAAAGTATALTAAALAGRPYDLVVSAGIGGGFAGVAPLGSVVVAETITAADLGAETPEGFSPVTALGFGTDTHRPPAALSRALAEAAGAVHGPVLTVSTVTGSAARAAELSARHPGAAAEAMEGFGVAEAAAAHGLPVLEIRAVSNPVGPRDRAAWRIPEALGALAGALGALAELLPAALPDGRPDTPPEAPAEALSDPPPGAALAPPPDAQPDTGPDTHPEVPAAPGPAPDHGTTGPPPPPSRSARPPHARRNP